jgi:hypothetical protein
MCILGNILSPLQEDIAWSHLLVETPSHLIDIFLILLKQEGCKLENISHFVDARTLELFEYFGYLLVNALFLDILNNL